MRLYHFKAYVKGSGNIIDRFTISQNVVEAKEKIEKQEEIRAAHKYVDFYEVRGTGVWGDKAK